MLAARQALDTIQANDKAKAVVLISAKPDGFIAGADINMLAAAKDEKELEEVRRLAWRHYANNPASVLT